MDFHEALREIKTDMIEKEKAFESVRKGYTELANASDSEILEHFSLSTSNELRGHVDDIKGILFEQEVQDRLIPTSNEGLLIKGALALLTGGLFA